MLIDYVGKHNCLTVTPDNYMLALYQGTLEVQQLDLADLDSVKTFANKLQSEPVIDMLILNAGVAGVPLTYTKDNFETQVGTNHFGHFVLVESLLDKLKQQVGSSLHTATASCHHQAVSASCGTLPCNDPPGDSCLMSVHKQLKAPMNMTMMIS